MMGIGLPELVVLFVLALLIFGPRKLPEIGRSLGKGIAEFKKFAEGSHSFLQGEEEHALPLGEVSPPPVEGESTPPDGSLPEQATGDGGNTKAEQEHLPS
ncbi:MAG: twin-arginine translocase TatA/TatE family subunit [Candidatus Eremiobacteraeota bacterium]|nr:twin-arginine translocase TatA/TatE family subunit [Candidatus Eremiobacteraeota bacterium]